MVGGSKSSTPRTKPSEVAADTKRNYLPAIKSQYPNQHSYLIGHPLTQMVSLGPREHELRHPSFFVQQGDPVDGALKWQALKRTAAQNQSIWIPVICGANDKRPGGDWETGVQGYEERLCRRSSLSATLATPASESQGAELGSNFPIPSTGGIFSPYVVVFRGPQYEKVPYEQWDVLPIVSVPPTRWPKLVPNGTKYSFSDERAMVKDKIRGALLVCAFNHHQSIVISGDWGLGNGYRNPPRELAEIWREVLLYDPVLRYRFQEVAFIFEDGTQSTSQLISAEMSKKDSKKSGGGKSSKESSSGSSKSSSSSSKDGGKGKGGPADADIFAAVFDENEIRRVTEQPDARYGLDNLLT
ncbi:hypothetical protein GE09DRAFT_1066052 [Coniochaeta sp. 2T2.1]|nr:hypothetical protein GE09DRAFT_1066052 [Coniochaeta sp. 2T2.1]